MELFEINPFPRTVGFFPEWIYENAESSVSYNFRIFAFTENPAVTFVGDGKFSMPQNSLLILAPGEPYRFVNETKDAPFCLHCISFDLTQEYRDSASLRLPTYVSSFQPEYLIDAKIRDGARDISNLSLPRFIKNRSEICDKVKLVYKLFTEKPIYYLERCSGIVKDILFASLSDGGAFGTERKSAAGALRAKETMRYIEEHFREPVNEQSIAAAQNYHPYYLTRLTLRYFGVTPYQYLIQCRIEEAVRLLVHTEKPIGEIAAECGFAGLSHFSNVVRRKTGLSPGKIRKNGRE